MKLGINSCSIFPSNLKKARLSYGDRQASQSIRSHWK